MDQSNVAPCRRPMLLTHVQFHNEEVRATRGEENVWPTMAASRYHMLGPLDSLDSNFVNSAFIEITVSIGGDPSSGFHRRSA
jgi:hypothetical protein